MKHLCTKQNPILCVLEKLYPDCSKTSLRSWLKDGRVSVDHCQVKAASAVVNEGQTITIAPRSRLIENSFPILYEDKHIVVVDKPEGLLSVSTLFEKKETVFSYLKRKYHPNPVYVVHRLDQDTSGVMLFALTQHAMKTLKSTFEKHDLTRKYIAIVEGKLEKSGTWRSYLVENSNYVVRATENPHAGELAITHFSVKTSTKAYTWLELTLETGKKNQIRVHCQDSGHPVVGDKKYGAHHNPLKRLCLHAQMLSFPHPETKKMMHFTSPIPEAFYRLI